jgi:hypothetical protein
MPKKILGKREREETKTDLVRAKRTIKQLMGEIHSL